MSEIKTNDNIKPIKFVEVENDRGETQLGVIEKLTENGEIIIRILSNNKILIFKSNFLVKTL